MAVLAAISFLRPAEWTYSGGPVAGGVRAVHVDTVDPMAYLLFASTGMVLAGPSCWPRWRCTPG